MAEVWAYYNELDERKCAWIRELMRAGVITDGEIDSRPVEAVQPDELRGFRRLHFFAGVGVWDYALQLAGWPEDEEVWTGSCPCQPFSAAGKRRGKADKRHLWPSWFRLIRERRPGVVFGEQVASRDGLAWFDAVQSDMEAETYTCRALDLCSAGFGAPHIRQRLFLVAYPAVFGRDGWRSGEPGNGYGAGESERLRAAGFLGHANGEGSQGLDIRRDGGYQRAAGEAGMAGPVNGYWRNAEWIWCKDERCRPVEPTPEHLAPVAAADLGSVCYQGRRIIFPLQKKAKARILRIRGAGDAIVAEAAAHFIRACMDWRTGGQASENAIRQIQG